MSHPYSALPARAFWRSGVAMADRDSFAGLYEPKHPLTQTTRVATAGSCFAQYIGTHLRGAGCAVLDVEPAPAAMPTSVAKTFGYGLFSARYGNIYSARQLLDLLQEVTADSVDPRHVWAKDGRFYDAFRPTVEPFGLDSATEVLLLRQRHLRKVAALLRQTDLLIFTLGLTEIWADRGTGRVFPVCPGVVAGQFDPTQHELLHMTHARILADLAACLALLKAFNPAIKLLLTVSPVPLTATVSGAHVLTASSWSKAILRGVAGECAAHPDVDYLPSYELLTHPAAQPPGGGHWFHANLRSVSAAGVARVMRFFLTAHGLAVNPEKSDPAPASHDATGTDDDALVCDEVLQEAFASPLAPA